jgi:hypothetical protein
MSRVPSVNQNLHGILFSTSSNLAVNYMHQKHLIEGHDRLCARPTNLLWQPREQDSRGGIALVEGPEKLRQFRDFDRVVRDLLTDGDSGSELKYHLDGEFRYINKDGELKN